MNDPLVRRLSLKPDEPGDLSQEWLVTNGLGGYASGTAFGTLTRRYHGLLIAALPAPMGRVAMLSHVYARVRLRASRPPRMHLAGTPAHHQNLAPRETY